MSTPLLRVALLLATTSATSACLVATSPRGGALGPRPIAAGPTAAPPAAAPAPAPAVGPARACADPGDRDFPDEIDRPVALAPDATTVGCLGKGDKDLFLVTVPPSAAGTLLTFEVGGEPDVALSLEVLDQLRKRQIQTYLTKGEQRRGWIHVAGGSSIYLRVAHTHINPGAYTLRLAAAPLTDATEPSSSPATARPLALDAPITGIMSHAANEPADGQEDWFAVDLTTPGTLVVDVDMSQDVAPTVIVLDGNRRRVAQTHGDRGERVVLEAKIKSPGRYLVQLRSNGRLATAETGEVPVRFTRPYTLTVSRRDAVEPARR